MQLDLLNLKRNIKRLGWIRNQAIYQLCKKYVDLYNSDNNLDIASNGELYLAEKYLPKSKIVFDVGANIGQWSTIALNIQADLELHCFEPNQSAFYSLSKNLITNYPHSYHILNQIGLDSQLGEKTLFVLFECSELNSLWQRNGLTTSKEEKVQVDTLDHYCSSHEIQHIDFLKIDVEGHELEVLKGAKNLLEAEKINLIQFEYNITHIDSRIFLKDIFDFFTNLNYSFYKLYPHQLRLISTYDTQWENFQYQNWAIIRHGWE